MPATHDLEMPVRCRGKQKKEARTKQDIHIGRQNAKENKQAANRHSYDRIASI